MNDARIRGLCTVIAPLLVQGCSSGGHGKKQVLQGRTDPHTGMHACTHTDTHTHTHRHQVCAGSTGRASPSLQSDGNRAGASKCAPTLRPESDSIVILSPGALPLHNIPEIASSWRATGAPRASRCGSAPMHTTHGEALPGGCCLHPRLPGSESRWFRNADIASQKEGHVQSLHPPFFHEGVLG